MIRYKVVSSDRKSLFTDGKYSFSYEKETVMSTDLGLGFMCFETKYLAEMLSEGFNGSKIIKVLPLDRGFRPFNVCKFQQSSILNQFYGLLSFGTLWKTASPSPGTICYHRIFVID